MKVKSSHPQCEGELIESVTNRRALEKWPKEYLETEREKRETCNIEHKERVMGRVKIYEKI